jgi:hypothetical protein
VSVLKVGCPWKTGGHESSRKPCSLTPTYDTPAIAGKQVTAGMLAISRITAATGTSALRKGHKQEKAQPSAAKTPATAGSVRKSYKSCRK